MTARVFITAPEVAGLIGYATAAKFRADRERLERDHDFPPPMPTSLRPLRWRRDAVEAWAAQQGIPSPRIDPQPGGNVVLMAEARRA